INHRLRHHVGIPAQFRKKFVNRQTRKQSSRFRWHSAALGKAESMANLRNTVFRAGLESLYFTGAHRVLSPLYGGVGLIFTLHHVRPARKGRFQPNRLLEITPQFLEGTIERLRKRGVDLVSMDELYRRLGEQDYSRRFAAFTFDDGYRDNLEF